MSAQLCLSQRVVELLDFRDLHVARQVCWAWYAAMGSRSADKQCVRRYGIPRECRMRFWLFQSQADKLAAECGGLAAYRSHFARSKFRTDNPNVSWFSLSQQPGLEGEIARDVTRTFPHRPLFRLKNSLGRGMLFNVLMALAVYDSSVGYCQGMNFVVAVLITVALHCDGPGDHERELAIAAEGLSPAQQEEVEAQVFWLMAAFLKRFDMRELWRPGVPQLKLRIFQFERLVSSKLPTMHAYFRSIGLAPDFFASQWFLTLMSYNMEMHQLVRVWDVLIIEGWKTIFKTGLALLAACETQIMSMSLEQLSQFFRHGNGLLLRNNEELAAAFSVKISTRELADLESEYITDVLFNNARIVNAPSEQAQLPTVSSSGKLSRASSVASFVADEVFVDHRLAVLFKEEIEHLDSDTRNDVQYLRTKIEEAERSYMAKKHEARELANDYLESKLVLDELQHSKKEASELLFAMTRSSVERDYLAFLERIEAIDARIVTVSKHVETALWKTSQVQVEMEEIVDKKNAFSHQLQGVLAHNEDIKSQTIKSLWQELSASTQSGEAS